jgi:hypothetical protein
MLALAQQVPVDACRLRMLKPFREALQERLPLGLGFGSASEMASASDRELADLARARQAWGEVRRGGPERSGELRILGDLDTAVACGHRTTEVYHQCTTVDQQVASYVVT